MPSVIVLSCVKGYGKLKSTSRLRRIVFRGIPITLVVCAVLLSLFTLWIELQLKNICVEATREYPGDQFEALMKSVKSDKYGYNAHLYKANNYSIWALGQLGDKRALPFLRHLLTGEPCDHETNICQGEINKAIQKLSSHQFNLPKYLWRGILN